MSQKVLLVDDDAALRKVLEFKLKKQGFTVVTAGDGDEALSTLRSSRFDVILSDMKMPRVSGIDVLEQAQKIQTDIKVILMTAFADVSQAVKAVKLGAFDYLIKPFEDDQLFIAIGKARTVASLERENMMLKKQIDSGKKPSMLGVSRLFKELIALIDKVAVSDATVLITGDSGTGKELVARLIHEKCDRHDKPFVAINCAAIPKDLIESELFGHVKGAFTGAVRDKRGKFELADGGTLLLDEISELSGDLQAKLLRAIQERAIEPVGSEQRIEVDVRLLASTNVDLKSRVASGKFREDLFYRLNVIPIRVPPLRDRRDDIPLLARHFLQLFANGQTISLSESLMNRFQHHHWPGNIRELENLIERMVVLRNSDMLDAADLPDDFSAVMKSTTSYLDTASDPSNKPADPIPVASRHHLSYHEAERRIVVEALEKSGWNRSKAARILKIPRHVLLYRIKRHNIIPPESMSD